MLAATDDDGPALGRTGSNQCSNGKTRALALLIAAPGGAFGKSIANFSLLWRTCPANGYNAQRSLKCWLALGVQVEYGAHPEEAWMRKCHPMQVPHLKVVGGRG